MSATARDYQSPNPPSTEGLDHLFQLTDQVEIQDQFQVEQAEFQIQDQVEPVESQDQFHLELLPLSKAAKLLGVSRRYANKLATMGRIPAVQDSRGHWLVRLEQGKIQIQDQVELSEIQDQFQLEQAGFQIQDHLEPVEIQDQFTELVFNEYKEQIKSLQQKLESATYRIGYLQHHVESQDLQIKLLTDSQHKPGRWQRFRSWFFGQ